MPDGGRAPDDSDAPLKGVVVATHARKTQESTFSIRRMHGCAQKFASVSGQLNSVRLFVSQRNAGGWARGFFRAGSSGENLLCPGVRQRIVHRLFTVLR